MPLLHISLRAGKPAAYRQAICDGLYRAMREARRTSQTKSNFIANVSHEIRTPLNGVVGMLGLLSESRLSREQREYVEVAKTSSDAPYSAN